MLIPINNPFILCKKSIKTMFKSKFIIELWKKDRSKRVKLIKLKKE